jgi:outer membrane protein assembly factor BamB
MRQPAPGSEEQPGRGGRNPRVGGGRGGPQPGPGAAGRGESVIFAGTYGVASDGVLHALGPLSGKDMLKPVPFLPANAQASDLVVVDDMLYTATSNGCGGVPNGVWLIDLRSDEKTVTSWHTDGGSPIGAPIFGTDGTLFVTIGAGATSASNGYANAVVALDPRTLKVKNWFTESGAGFVTAPTLFKYKNRDLIAAAASDGRVFLLDAASLGGSNHQTPLFVSPKTGALPGSGLVALATWEDSNGTRWVLEPVTRPIPAGAGIRPGNGSVSAGAVVAFKVTGEGDKVALQPAWASRDMMSPVTPLIVNGIIFAASSGEYRPSGRTVTAAETVRRSAPAVVYALDADTGKELWNSGTAVTSFVHSGGLWAGGGQVYLSTYDNTIYAFGYAMGRH